MLLANVPQLPDADADDADADADADADHEIPKTHIADEQVRQCWR